MTPRPEPHPPPLPETAETHALHRQRLHCATVFLLASLLASLLELAGAASATAWLMHDGNTQWHDKDFVQSVSLRFADDAVLR